MRDAVAHQTAVDLQLALALAKAAADAAARLLAHQVAPHAPQARQHILQLCQLHLQAPLVRGGVLAKDVQDECRAVDDLDGLSHDPLEVRLLGGCQFVIEYHHVNVKGPHHAHELLHLATADEGTRHGLLKPLSELSDHDGTVRHRQATQLRHRVPEGPYRVTKVDAHQERTLRRRRRRSELESSHASPFHRMVGPCHRGRIRMP